ncbi:hypothetical protein FZEAL_7627 [Fusarium zealandicum]|uniref:Uncharacterized protein n=1 Tax=Fusarium zealandicum TaxID=1053134 RepID=A0A8H4UG91_9HYPO|nr:hypothetical protein FZEAL_7627 [Fusarium zealandicum]
MKLASALTILASAPFLAFAGPISEPQGLENRQAGNCRVNRLLIDTWHESAQSRRRVAFSSENTPPENYCKYWKSDMYIRNVQCYQSKSAGSWVVDVNTDLGAVGDQVFNDKYVDSIRDWRIEYKCATG